MTPGARVAAAISVVEAILAGRPAEVALVNWGRANRYAGSGDRAAVRDIVFDVLRCRRSCAALGGGEGARALVLGWARRIGKEALFDGQGYGPAAPQPDEKGRKPEGSEAFDCPDWLEPRMRISLGDRFEPVMSLMQHRAPVFLRVNTTRLTREDAVKVLADEGIIARPHVLAKTALEVVEGARKIHSSRPYVAGLIELQDAASQAVVEMLPLEDGMSVLDLCAGGGGKTLAMAARARLRLFAHDAEVRRMADLPQRAERARVQVRIVPRPEAEGPFDLVLADVPCSGSGSWRRDPEGKWALTPERLSDLLIMQAGIMDRAARLVRTGGVLAYATCSLLDEENHGQVAAFLHRNRDWSLQEERGFTPLDGGDGFYGAVLRRVG